jgi:RNA polymerase sigma-70 factor (ECF subfamily)
MAIDPAAPAVDATSVGRFFDDWIDTVYGFVARRVEDREAAEEVTARTFQRAIGELRDGRLGLDELSGFLLRVAGSAVLDHARRQRRTLPSGVRATDLDDEGDAEAALWLADAEAARALEAAIDGIELRRAVGALDDQERRLVLLRYLDGLDADGMAAVLACPPEQAALGVHRALTALHPSLPERDAHVA